MSAYPSLPLFTDAFIADTGHLSAQETGAYLMLMMVAWRSPDCRLAADDDRLARWARVDRRTWLRIKPNVMEFWALDDGFWTQKRLSKEREFVSKRADVSRRNGEQGGRPKSLKNNDAPNPTGSAQDSQTKAPNPSPNPREEKNRTEPNGSASLGSATPETDPRRDLFARGLAEIRQMTGMPEPRCRTLLGKWLKAADDSAVIVMAAIDSAAMNEVASAIPFIEMTIRSEAERNGSRTANLFAGRPSGGRSQGTGVSAAAAAVARHASREGFGPGVRTDDCGPGDEGRGRSGRHDPEIPDADWSPAPRHRAAY